MGQQEGECQAKMRDVETSQKRLKQKARKLLGNYMQRYYSENTAMRFKHWKLLIVSLKERATVLKRTMAHMKKYQFL
jgi:hypothetical protein